MMGFGRAGDSLLSTICRISGTYYFSCPGIENHPDDEHPQEDDMFYNKECYLALAGCGIPFISFVCQGADDTEKNDATEAEPHQEQDCFYRIDYDFPGIAARDFFF